VLFTAFATARLFGTQAGLIAGAVLAGSVLWNVIGHVNTLDMGVSFFLARRCSLCASDSATTRACVRSA